ncbi:MAG: flagellin [Candidatus Hinthialibacter antarcticus]|nr:flagellin [Candidatus Hinthialibacter antarcticus]
MVINSIANNISALHIINQLNSTQSSLNTNLQRISSGLRINSPADDPSGFVLSNKISSQFRGLNRASENTQTTLNLVNTGTAALSQITELLNDIRDSAVAASGGSATEQAVILEKIDELNRIATTTKFDGKYLLNGALATDVDFRNGTRPFGASLAFGPNATDLLAGRSFLNIAQTNSGSTQIKVGGDATFNTGLVFQNDLAVSASQFINGGAAAAGGTALVGSTVNRVSLLTNGSIQFSGVLANGATSFSGSLSIAGGTTVTNLVTSIQSSIDAAETSIGVNGTGTLETTVGIDGNGRLTFSNGQNQITEFDATLTVRNSSNAIQTQIGITRDTDVFNIEAGATTTSAAIGNNITAVTGSTFDSGAFNITVSNIIAPEQRQLTIVDEFDRNFGGASARAIDPVNGSFLNGVSIVTGDTFTINGTEADGTTFSTQLTVGVDGGAGDGLIDDYGSLIAEINNRDKTKTAVGFQNSIATLNDATGKISLFDDLAQDSVSDLQIIVDRTLTSNVDIVNSGVDQTGAEATAALSINGGPAQTATVGQVVTLQGVNLSGGTAPEVTFRVGRNFVAGTDQLQTTAKEFVGSLNGGTLVTFQNGDSDVQFTAGDASIYPIKKFQQVTLDFDSILDITTPKTAGGETFVISTTNKALTFQIGGDSDQFKQILFADVTSDNLGSSASATLDNIDVTTASGATAAIAIADAALTQVTDLTARLGAFQSRLNDTINSLDSGALALETAFVDIVSADLATETTQLARNSILLQAEAAVLVQSNALSNSVFEILLGLRN